MTGRSLCLALNDSDNLKKVISMCQFFCLRRRISAWKQWTSLRIKSNDYVYHILLTLAMPTKPLSLTLVFSFHLVCQLKQPIPYQFILLDFVYCRASVHLQRQTQQKNWQSKYLAFLVLFLYQTRKTIRWKQPNSPNCTADHKKEPTNWP